ncbi:GNAT family N-acetyltransferase [Clavibacter michiganensis]|uniref:GNAT family N-acetyltransferase n=1 Tax=Clavibacter michiganensis TaxID=28447 RepID=A0A2S5VTZ7_9MICO|nr:GNAT family protein [Clavibacter michiganensis]PPF67385.1 GNAT family N-acetyltransferase [Clavibacter michiganensis]
MHGPHLRPWTASDASALRDAFLSTPDLMTQLGGADLSTAAAAEAHIAGPLASDDAHRAWVIVDGGVAVGSVGVSAIDRRHDTAWLHYWLAGSGRGRGLATRALAGAAEWAFADGLFRLELGHRVNNPASCRVATRAGFAAEGIERAKLRYGDERFDVEAHARLATDPAPVLAPLPGTVEP